MRCIVYVEHWPQRTSGATGDSMVPAVGRSEVRILVKDGGISFLFSVVLFHRGKEQERKVSKLGRRAASLPNQPNARYESKTWTRSKTRRDEKGPFRQRVAHKAPGLWNYSSYHIIILHNTINTTTAVRPSRMGKK